MILHVFALKNRLSGIYERPFCEPYDVKDYAEVLAQSLAYSSIDDLYRHREFDVYCLGTFDNKSGVLTGCEDFILSLEALCNSYIASKEKKESSNVSSQEV